MELEVLPAGSSPMAAELMPALSGICMIVFNSFCFSLVSTAWINLTRRDIFFMVSSVYTLAMLYATVLTLRARRGARVYQNPGFTNKFRSAYVQLGGMCIFLLPFVFNDLFKLIEDSQCLSAYIHVGCNNINSGLDLTMTATRVAFVGVQVIHVLWLAPKIRRGDSIHIDTGPHLVNAAVDIALLIYTILHESKDIFSYGHGHGHSVPVERCLNASHTSAWYEMAEACLKRDTFIGKLRKEGDRFLTPLVTEFYFMAIALLIGQWQTIKKLKAPNAHEITDDSTERQPSLIGQHQGVSAVFYFVFLTCIANIVVGVASYNNDKTMFLVFTCFLLLNLIQGTGIAVYISSKLYKVAKARERMVDIELNNELGLVLLSASGVFAYKFALITPYIMAILSPGFSDQLFAEAPYNSSSYLVPFLGIDLVNAFFEITLSAVSMIMVLLVHHDMDHKALTRLNDRNVKAFLYVLAMGSLCFWGFKSMLFFTFSSNLTPQITFYGRKSWTLIVHLVNPPSVYFHFHVALIIIEYIVSI